MYYTASTNKKPLWNKKAPPHIKENFREAENFFTHKSPQISKTNKKKRILTGDFHFHGGGFYLAMRCKYFMAFGYLLIAQIIVLSLSEKSCK